MNSEENKTPVDLLRELREELVDMTTYPLNGFGVVRNLLLAGKFIGYIEMLRAVKTRTGQSGRINELGQSISELFASPRSVYQMIMGCTRPRAEGDGPIETMERASLVSGFDLAAHAIVTMRNRKRSGAT